MDDDAMDIDTHSQSHPLQQAQSIQPHSQPPHKTKSSRSPEQILDNLLTTYLTPFITRQITRTLGSEYLHLYGPPSNASPRALLKILESRWLGVFSDSPLHSSHHVITRLLASYSEYTPLPTFAALTEELLLAIGQSSAAAEAAMFRGKSPSPIPQRRQPFPAAPPPTPRPQPRSSSSAHIFDDTQMTNPDKFTVVLDGSNIAWRHGKTSFSMHGLLKAREHFLSRNHKTVTFLPEARVTQEHQSLHETPDIVLTPSKDYDDAYIVHYARTNMAVVVSNDEFRDVVYQASADGPKDERQWKEWLKACRLSFTFHGDTFLPNPAFNWKRALRVASELRLRE